MCKRSLLLETLMQEHAELTWAVSYNAGLGCGLRSNDVSAGGGGVDYVSLEFPALDT